MTKRHLRIALLALASLASLPAFAQSVNPFVRPAAPAAPDPVQAAVNGTGAGPVGMNAAGVPGTTPKQLLGPGTFSGKGFPGGVIPPNVPPVPGSTEAKDKPATPEVPELHVKFVGQVNGMTVLKAGASYHFNKDKRVAVKLIQDTSVPAPAAPAAGTPGKPVAPPAGVPAPPVTSTAVPAKAAAPSAMPAMKKN